MKRTFLAKRNALLSAQSISWGVFALVFALFMLFLRLVAPNSFWHAVSPVFKASDAFVAESHTFFSSFSDAAALAEQNEKLKNEHTALVSENDALTQKIESLSLLLGAPSEKRGSGILAGVIARPPVSPYDTLVLAVGEKDGVEIGMEAFGPGGVPVGIVSSVLNDFSRVALFSAPGMTTSGWVGNANTALMVTGEGAGAMKAFVANSVEVSVGDTVYLPGPGMLPAGQVIRMDKDSLSPGMTLRIAPRASPFSLLWVQLRATGIAPSAFTTATLP